MDNNLFHHRQEAIVQEQSRTLSDNNHKEHLFSPQTTETTTTTSTKKLQSLSLDLGLDLCSGMKFERGCAGSDDSLYRRQIVEEQKSALISDDVPKGYLLPKTSATTTKNTKKHRFYIDVDLTDRVRRQKVATGCYDRRTLQLFGKEDKNVSTEEQKGGSSDNDRRERLLPKTSETSLDLDLSLTDHRTKAERGSVSDDSSLCHHRPVQEHCALSDNDHKRHTLPKTSETTTKNTKKRQSSETTTKNTKKRQSSADLDSADRVRRQKVERGCDRCTFRLFGVDISVKNCEHMNSESQQDSETKKTKKYQKTKQKKEASSSSPAQQQLPQSIVELINRSGGTILHHIGTKNLTDTDVNKHQSRLSFTNSEALLNVLTPQERDKVTSEQSEGMEVEMIDVSGRKYTMNIRKRPYNVAIVINRQWSKLASENSLKSDDVVQLWGFRRSNGEFSLVLNVVRRRDNGDGGSSSKSNGEGSSGGFVSSS